MALFRFSPSDPFHALLSLQQELERAYENPLGFDLGLSGRGVFPPVNVFRDQNNDCIVRIEAPGIDPRQFTIEAQGRTLTVSGKRETSAPKEGSFHRRERNHTQFSRSLQLPADLDLSRAEASHKQGMLTIRIPKREDTKPRQINVQTV